MSQLNPAIALAIVQINLLDPAKPWNFDGLGRSVVADALQALVDDYEAQQRRLRKLESYVKMMEDDGK